MELHKSMNSCSEASNGLNRTVF